MKLRISLQLACELKTIAVLISVMCTVPLVPTVTPPALDPPSPLMTQYSASGSKTTSPAGTTCSLRTV